jgi:hypothetical protein
MKLVLAVVVAGILSLVATPSWAEDELDPVAMAKALSQASLPLEKACKVSEREGKPISAKYEIENGTLQLSIYTMKGSRFSELIVDHTSGAVAKDEWITDTDDLKAAQAQAAVMAKAKVTIDVPRRQRRQGQRRLSRRERHADARWRATGCCRHPDERSRREESGREARLMSRLAPGGKPCTG